MSIKYLVILVVLGTSASCAGRKAAWQGDDKAGGTAAADVQKLVADGDALWAERTDPAKIKAAIGAWEKAAAADPKNLEVLVKLTRGNYFLADAYLRDDEKEYLRRMDLGVKWGEKAMIAASPEFESKMRAGGKLPEAVKSVPLQGVAAMYWYASSLGKWAKRKGFAVLLGQKDNVKATMDRVLALDPNFYYGGPHRYFGAYYAIAPAFAGGDLGKSKVHFEKSIAIEPLYIGTKVLWAQELAVKEQDEATFDRLIKEILATPDDVLPDVKPETIAEKQKARELLEEKEDLF
jgi:TRAP transporter T-component